MGDLLTRAMMMMISALVLFALVQSVQITKLARDTNAILSQAEQEVASREYLMEQRILQV